MLLTEEVYRPRKYVALLPLIAPVVLSFFVFVKHVYPPKQLALITTISVLASVVIYVLLNAVQIRLNGEGILFRAITGERRLPWTALQAVRVHRVRTGKTSHLEMVLERNDGDRPATLNVKLYSRHALQRITSAIVAKAPQAQIDARVQEFAEGRFPWYVL
jgi:hypothetical protein